MWPYVEFKSKFTMPQRVPRGFKEALEATDDAVKAQPQVLFNILFDTTVHWLK